VRQTSGTKKTTLALLERELDAARRQLREALEQQTATSEVLRVISNSAGELEPVFQALMSNAVRLCEAKFGVLYQNEGGRFRMAAAHDVPPPFALARSRRGLFHPAPGSPVDQVMKTRRTVQIADVAATRAYAERHPTIVEAVELGGVRTSLSVPMLKENEVIGVIIIYRQEVRPFSDRQVALLTNFAHQAVIAIENARLLNELRRRTTDLSEALEQQTATSGVLRVISSSSGELAPVFESLLASAKHLCGAEFGIIFLREGMRGSISQRFSLLSLQIMK